MPGAAKNTACTVKHGPSLLSNNLTASSQGLAYVHGNQVSRASDKLQDTVLSSLHCMPSWLQVSLVKPGSPRDGTLLSPQGSKVSMTPAPLDASMLQPVQLNCAACRLPQVCLSTQTRCSRCRCAPWRTSPASSSPWAPACRCGTSSSPQVLSCTTPFAVVRAAASSAPACRCLVGVHCGRERLTAAGWLTHILAASSSSSNRYSLLAGRCHEQPHHCKAHPTSHWHRTADCQPPCLGSHCLPVILSSLHQALYPQTLH